MQFKASGIYHLYNRGHNRQPIFFQARNYHYFLQKAKTYLLPHCNIICYCLMPNHFHFLIQVKEDYPEADPNLTLYQTEYHSQGCFALNNNIGIMLRSYARGVNHQEKRIGALFQEKTKAKNHLELFYQIGDPSKVGVYPPLVCFNYIHQNPVKAGLVGSTLEWPYSSARAYAGRAENQLCEMAIYQQMLQLIA
ncbi:MAG: hypothetical protein AAFP19_25580 [Bacteroidota bacterium]